MPQGALRRPLSFSGRRTVGAGRRSNRSASAGRGRHDAEPQVRAVAGLTANRRWRPGPRFAAAVSPTTASRRSPQPWRQGGRRGVTLQRPAERPHRGVRRRHCIAAVSRAPPCGSDQRHEVAALSPPMASRRSAQAPHRGGQPSHRRALRNIRIHGESSPSPGGCHDSCTVRRTRSGCGIRMVKRPSGVVRPVMPPGEPFGLYG